MGYADEVAVSFSSRAALLLAVGVVGSSSSSAFAQETAPAAAPAAPAADPSTTVDRSGTVPLPPATSTVPAKYVVVASLGAVGAASFLVSAVFDSLAGDAHSDAVTLAQNRACGSGPSCSAFDDKHDAAHTDRITSGALAGLGGLALVGAAAAWFFWPDDEHHDHPSSTSAWILPSVGPQGPSLTVGGRF